MRPLHLPSAGFLLPARELREGLHEGLSARVVLLLDEDRRVDCWVRVTARLPNGVYVGQPERSGVVDEVVFGPDHVLDVGWSV